MKNQQPFSFSQWLRSRTGLVFLAFIAIAIFFLVTEHTAHFFGVLPYLLLLLCPLLQLFMHGGHGEHGEHGESMRNRSSGGHAVHNGCSQQNQEGGMQ